MEMFSRAMWHHKGFKRCIVTFFPTADNNPPPKKKLDKSLLLPCSVLKSLGFKKVCSVKFALQCAILVFGERGFDFFENPRLKLCKEE